MRLFQSTDSFDVFVENGERRMGWSPLEAHSLRLRCHLRAVISPPNRTPNQIPLI